MNPIQVLINWLDSVLNSIWQLANWAIDRIIDLLLVIWPSSSSLGIPSVLGMISGLSARYPWAPWGVVLQAVGFGLSFLGGVLIWKVFALLWI